MNSKQAISLLLAAQMIGTPVAQAAPLSPDMGGRIKTPVAGETFQRIRLNKEKNVSFAGGTLKSSGGDAEENSASTEERTEQSSAEESKVTTPVIEVMPIPVTTPDVNQISDETENAEKADTSLETPVIETTPADAETTVPQTTTAPEETTDSVSAVSSETDIAILRSQETGVEPQEATALTGMDGIANVYIGYGYEAMKADVPGNNSLTDNKALGIVAVEKKLKSTQEWNSTVTPDKNPFLSVVGQFFDDSDNENMSWIASDEYGGGKWEPRSDGKFYLDDLKIYTGDGWDKGLLRSLRELTEGELGRVPDYEFDCWAVYGWNPVYRRGLIWRNALLFQAMDGDVTQNIENTLKNPVTKIPVYPSEFDLKIPYGTALSPENVEIDEGDIKIKDIKNTIIDSADKASRKPLDESVTNYDEYINTVYKYNIAYDDGWRATGDLPLIAHWKLSSNATLVEDTKINAALVDSTEDTTVVTAFYTVEKDASGTTKTTTTNILDAVYSDATRENVTTIAFDKSGKSYYLGVDSSVEGISPDLIAYEAFKFSNVDTDDMPEEYGVTVSVKQAGKENYTDYEMSSSILNDSVAAGRAHINYTTDGGSVDDIVSDLNDNYRTDGFPVYTLYNSVDTPMRSRWTLSTDNSTKYIPLTVSTENGRYNEIKVTVTAPDGETKNTYTFYIERLGDPEIVQNPGNTPFGMIQRDTGAAWNQLVTSGDYTDVATAKKAVQELFKTGFAGIAGSNSKPYSFGGRAMINSRTPRGKENNNGNYDRDIVYTTSAWLGDNIDLDENAIIAYQNSSFVDPGFTVYNSRGDKVDLSKGNVKRSVVLKLADGALSVDSITDTNHTEHYYNNGTMTEVTTGTDTFQVVTDADGKSRIDLRGQKVIPGVYTIEYSFTDPLSGKTYSSTSNNFVDADIAKGFSRTLVILPIPGDINMDGAVTPIDGEILRRELENQSRATGFLSQVGTNDVVSLFAYRVCDVNNDGVIDMKDVDTIRKGYAPMYVEGGESPTGDYNYYLPLPDGLSQNEKEEWNERQEQQVFTDDTIPSDNDCGKLSLEYIGIHTDEITNDPKKLDDAQKPSDGLTVGDVFWVGVQVSDLDQLRGRTTPVAITGGLSAVSMSIVYDSRYLEPAVIGEGSWEDTIKSYNIESGTSYTKSTWPSYYSVAENSRCAEDYVPHYSTAISTLEQANGSSLKEVVVAFKAPDTTNNARYLVKGDGEDSYYLLRIPFKLTAVPMGATTLEALEMSLGMDGLVILSTTASENTTVQASWSEQAEIFGGNTQNLKDELIYMDGSARSIPLGEDTTEKHELLNGKTNKSAVYGEEFVNREIGGKTFDTTKLPKGLSRNGQSIEGIPEEVGTFELEVTDAQGERTRYQIIVEKAPLTLTATAQTLYYGEDKATLTYTYDKDQIKDIDKTGGANYKTGFVNDGTAAELEKLDGYKAPDLSTAMIQGGDAGDYTITIKNKPEDEDDTSALTNYGSGLKNYYFVYANGDGEGTPGTSATSKLTVKKRPLLVQEITNSGVEVFVSDSQSTFSKTASYQNQGTQNGYVLKDLTQNSSYSGLTGDPVYNTDVVTISFTARLEDSERNSTTPYYTIPAGQATMQITANIYGLAITGDEAKNYELVNSKSGGYVMPEKTTAPAKAVASRVTGITVSEVPDLSYDYGSVLSIYGLHVTLTRSDGSETSYNYRDDSSLTNFDSLGIQITWEENTSTVSRDDSAHALKSGTTLKYDPHNGKYLCVSVPGYDNDGNPITCAWYSENPMEVRKKKLRLTVVPKTIYYGEYGTTSDPKLTYTYVVDDLTNDDKAALLATLANNGIVKAALEGTEDELKYLTGYVAPKMEAWTSVRNGTDSEKVTEDTDARTSPYYIYIYNELDTDGKTVKSGAADYTFYYTLGNTETSSTTEGYGSLKIEPRPIVVDSVALGANSDVFIYDDTRDLTVRNMYYKDGNGDYVAKPITVSGVNSTAAATQDTFVAKVPTGYMDGTTNSQVNMPYALSGDAIHSRQKADGTTELDKVVLTYRVTYTADPGREYVTPPATTYFDMNGQASKMMSVKIDGLELSNEDGTANANYVLVYEKNTTLTKKSPNTAEAQAAVKLRPIEKVEVTAPANNRSYTYGSQLDLTGLKLKIQYAADGDNAYSANKNGVIERELLNTKTSTGDTFQEQGLKTYWVSANEDWSTLTATDLANKAATLTEANRGSYPDVAKSGMKLVVLGQRHSTQDWVWGMTDDSAVYQIAKKKLPLQVGTLNRFYGENNATADRPYTAKFRASSLAQIDRDILANTGINATNGFYTLTAENVDNNLISATQEVTTPAISNALTTINADYESNQDTRYVGPRFTTAGTQGSDVGKYTIGLDLTDSQLANYELTLGSTGVLQVFRRPVQVTQVTKNPVLTIYFDTKETRFPAYAEYDGQNKTEFSMALPTLTSGMYESSDPDVIAAVNSGMVRAMPLTGSAFYAGDSLGLNMTVVYPAAGSRNQIPSNAVDVSQSVTVEGLSFGGTDAKNYYLINVGAPGNRNATGMLDRRTIKEIKTITGLNEENMTYTYGDTLDLTSLNVEVTYNSISTGSIQEAEKTVTLTAGDLLGRLSVYYWDKTTAPTVAELDTARPAASGDHLTIAPVHDDPNFAHNGKYLVVAARAHETTQDPAEPKLVANAGTNVPIALKVNPLDLTYKLTANGKVYDGTKTASGSIVLTNTYVDQNVEATTPDRDLVYVVTTGTIDDSDLKAALNDSTKDRDTVYTFESGTTGLTFTFFDPNVVYYEGNYTNSTPVEPADWQNYWDTLNPVPQQPGESGWDKYENLKVAPMPVLVSGITLAGPDAANYTLDGTVSLTDNADISGNKDTVPYAAIEKAERQVVWTEIPQVSVDAHTNTVQVIYDDELENQLTATIPGDTYHSEIHYEYALEYSKDAPEADDVQDTNTGLYFWNGTDTWSDERYFGGEQYVGAEVTEKDNKNESNIVKGQNYPWATEDTTFGTRTPLDRNTVYWGAVRVAATRNYSASAWITATDSTKTAQDSADAQQRAEEISDLITSWVQDKPKEGDDVDPAHGPADAVKTYQQGFVIYSTEQVDGDNGKKVDVDVLEATWFSDLQIFEKKENLDAVLRNQIKTRYYSYYWDTDHSASVKFDSPGLDLTQPFSVDIREKQDDGSTEEKTIDVNKDNTAYLYVTTQSSGGGGMLPDHIDINFGGSSGGGAGGSAGTAGGGSSASANNKWIIGDAPITLKVTFSPTYAINEGVLWESSDSRVVRVNEEGKVYFVGVGTAVITATTRTTHKTATVTIEVSDPNGLKQGVGTAWESTLKLANSEDNHFNLYHVRPYFTLEKGDKFNPTKTMTRGELVSILVRFYEPFEKFEWDGETPFSDLTGEEEYANAAEFLQRRGVINGMPDGTFSGEREVTRAEIAAILCRMMGLTPVKRENCTTFVDYNMQTTKWSDGYVEALARAGAVNGSGNGYFHPERVLTREETAAMMGRLLLSGTYYGTKGAQIVPTDVDENRWSYGLILRSVNAVSERKK